MERPVRVGLISLGCAKNLVDSEAMLGALRQAGAELTSDPGQADVLVVNTCGFIEPAKKESVDTILEMARYKEAGTCRKLVVTGCLAQRYHRELAEALPEVDVWLGIDDVERVVEACLDDRYRGDRVSSERPRWVYDLQVPRLRTTPRHYAYLKIAEGCNHTCSFCAIPRIRGKYRSRSLDSILEEARRWVEQGVRELILISQDTTYYGLDIGLKDGLLRLLEALHGLEDLRWIRLLYLYPDTLPPDFPERFRDFPKLCHYLDLPLQHSHPEILRAMKRRGSRERYLELLARYRAAVPDIVLRTTFIVGFPGETEAHFEDLCRFVEEARFDHVGVFEYSDEDGTAAYDLRPKVPRRVAARRRRTLMTLQQKVLAEKVQAWVGRRVEVVVDGFLRQESGRWLYRGRHYGQAPEVDGHVEVIARRPLIVGRWYPVHIRAGRLYDYQADLEEETVSWSPDVAGSVSVASAG